MQFNDLDPNELRDFLAARLHRVPKVASCNFIASSLRLKRLSHSRELTPDLTYGRHRGQPPVGCRFAAVALMLYRDPFAGWVVDVNTPPHNLVTSWWTDLFARRSNGSGGNPRGSLLAVSTKKSLGSTRPPHQSPGALDIQIVYASANLVLPLVFVAHPPSEDWKPDPAEVAEVIEVPMTAWLHEEGRVVRTLRKSVRSQMGDVVSEFSFSAPGVEILARTYRGNPDLSSAPRESMEKHFVWGGNCDDGRAIGPDIAYLRGKTTSGLPI